MANVNLDIGPTKRNTPQSGNITGVFESGVLSGYTKYVYKRYGGSQPIKLSGFSYNNKTFSNIFITSAFTSNSHDFLVNTMIYGCKRLEECSFFTMSFEVKDNSVAFETVTNFCKGEPRNILVKDGNLLAQKITGERQGIVNEAKTTPMRHIRPSFYFGGPITNDHYYDDMSAGSLVPATKL